MTEKEVNITKKVFDSDTFKVGDAEQHAKRTAENIEQGVQPAEYKDKKSTAYSSAESLERTIGRLIDEFNDSVEEVDKFKDDEEFQTDLQDGFVDADAFKEADDAVEAARELIPAFTVLKEVIYRFSQQQDKMIDIQKLAHDESRVKQFIESMVELQRERFDRQTESFEERMKRRDEKIEELYKELNSIKKTNAKKDERLAEALENLSESISDSSGIQTPNHSQGGQLNTGFNQPQRQQSGGRMQPQQNRQVQNQGYSDGGNGQRQSQNQGGGQQSQEDNDGGSQNDRPDLDSFDLKEKDRELIEKFWEHEEDLKTDGGYTQTDLAEDVGYTPTTVSKKLKEYDHRGIIDR